MSEDKVYIDYDAAKHDIVDKALRVALLALIPEKSSRDIVRNFLKIHRKYGIDTITSINILTDLSKLYEKSKEESDGQKQ